MLPNLWVAPFSRLLGQVTGQVLVSIVLVKGQPPDLHVVPVEPELAYPLQVVSRGIYDNMVVQPPAGETALRYIDVTEGLASGPAQLAEEPLEASDRLAAVLGEVLVIIGKRDKQIAVVKVRGQLTFQLLERCAGVELFPRPGTGLLLLRPGLGRVPGGRRGVQHGGD